MTGAGSACAVEVRVIIQRRGVYVALNPGELIGPYRVVAQIGQGGMGEVYRATDTKLHREVALKVLPASFTHDAARVARFTREAQVLASLNHPNIGGIYGLEEAHGSIALVLELIEGPTLADLLANSTALPLDQALGIARQIAAALEAAHERSIVHRDLKPANIKVRADGTVKVLDFGLAKALDNPSGVDVSKAPTVTGLAPTEAGVILGTAAYMSPEQAAGQVADRRSDIWSFGIVLMEMLTGGRVFHGETMTHVLASVLRDEPAWPSLPASTPESVRRLLRRCLEKDRRKRLDSATAVLLELDDVRGPAAAPQTLLSAPSAVPVVPASRRSITSLAVASVAGAALAAVAGAIWMMPKGAPAAVAPPVVRFTISPPPAQEFGPSPQTASRDFAVAPDASFLVYRATDGRLMSRAFNRLDAVPVPGVTSAYMPSVSPDSKWIAYVDDGPALKKVAASGGTPVTLAKLPVWPRGLAWADDATLIVGTLSQTVGLLKVSAGGGDPVTLTTPDRSKGEEGHLLPTALPGGRAVLFTIGTTDPRNAQIAILDLQSGTQTVLLRGGRDARYLPSGHLVYLTDRVMSAVRFDLASRTVNGEPVRVLDGLSATPTSALNAAITDSGTLVFVPTGVAGAARRLYWVDRRGADAAVGMPARPIESLRLSPDGTQVAVSIRDGDNDIWLWNLARQTLTRQTFDPDIDLAPVWTPDGRRLLFASTRTGAFNIYSHDVNDPHGDVRLLASPNTQLPNSVTPDGSGLIAHDVRLKTKSDLIRVPLTSPAGGAPVDLVNGPFDEWNGELSPDGRFLAYQSTESDAIEVFVRPYADANGPHWQVSSGGGVEPVWSRDGRELIYLDASRRLTSVKVGTSGSTFTFGTPTTISTTPIASGGIWRSYDIAPDGQRFLVMKQEAGTSLAVAPGFVVVQNWLEELRALVPSR